MTYVIKNIILFNNKNKYYVLHENFNYYNSLKILV